MSTLLLLPKVRRLQRGRLYLHGDECLAEPFEYRVAASGADPFRVLYIWDTAPPSTASETPIAKRTRLGLSSHYASAKLKIQLGDLVASKPEVNQVVKNVCRETLREIPLETAP